MKILTCFLLMMTFACSGGEDQKIKAEPPPGPPETCEHYIYIMPIEYPRTGFKATLVLGRDPHYLAVACFDTVAKHDSVSALTGVVAFPQNIDNTIPQQQVGNVKSKLAARKVPQYWVDDTITWRELIRFIANYTQVWQRLWTKNKGKFFDSNMTMNTQWQDFPQKAKDAIIDTADSFGFDKSGITGTSTLKEILRSMVDQMSGIPLTLGGLEI